MIEFNHTIWNKWILEGYKFIIFKELNNHINLKPVKGVIEEEMLFALKFVFMGLEKMK